MAAALPTSRNLEINGLKFHYLDWGGDGPPLVMLHGLTGHAHTWDHTAAALSGRYQRYALSPRQQPVVTLRGLSMGGIVAYQFTAAHPERVSRLVVLDIGPEIAPAGGRQGAAGLGANDLFRSEDEAGAHAR